MRPVIVAGSASVSAVWAIESGVTPMGIVNWQDALIAVALNAWQIAGIVGFAVMGITLAVVIAGHDAKIVGKRRRRRNTDHGDGPDFK
jgi:hypothetical protein